MLGVRIAAAWIGLILSSVTVQAMSVQADEQLLPPGAALFTEAVAHSVDHARVLPLGTPLFISSVGILTVDSDRAMPLPPGTPLFKTASPTISVANQDQPLPPGTPLFVSSIATPEIELAEQDRPLPPGTPLFGSAITTIDIGLRAQPLPPGTPLFASAVRTATIDLADRDQPLPPGSPLFGDTGKLQGAAVRQGTDQARAEAGRAAFTPARL